MAENATLKATLRTETGKSAARRMRREGRIPAVVYGRDEQTRSLSLDAHEFEMLVKQHALDTTLIDLTIEGRKGDRIRALVSEVQAHPYKAEVLHVDFHQIHAGERVTVEVPIRLAGTPAGVRAGGVLQHVLHEVELECAVEDIPEALEADVSTLEIGDSIHVSQLDVPAGIELLMDPERTVCIVAAPTVLEIAEAAAEEAVEGAAELRGAEEAEGEPTEAEGE